MKERPILMSIDNVRAILDGRKTQTRGVIKQNRGNEWLLNPDIGWDDAYIKDPDNELLLSCPFGQGGDRLWARETWARIILNPTHIYYKADDPKMEIFWRPSIFMPRWASRITLEITEVRVERLQEITEEDAEAEGLNPAEYDNPNAYTDYPCTNQFITLWDSLNAKRGYGWDKNPWVWVISFKAVK